MSSERHILKTISKVDQEKLLFLCYSSLLAIRHADPHCITHVQMFTKFTFSLVYNNIPSKLKMAVLDSAILTGFSPGSFGLLQRGKDQKYPIQTPYLQSVVEKVIFLY